jgi:hypothetical protein
MSWRTASYFLQGRHHNNPQISYGNLFANLINRRESQLFSLRWEALEIPMTDRRMSSFPRKDPIVSVKPYSDDCPLLLNTACRALALRSRRISYKYMDAAERNRYLLNPSRCA